MNSPDAFFPVLAVLTAYLIGSLSFAVIVSHLMGLNDPRTYGSKNPGATNVLRSGHKPAAVVTLLLDALKGLAPVLVVKFFGPPYGLEDGTVAMVGLAAFVGHLAPIFFHFQGGKGVATAFGVLLGINWALGLAIGMVWLCIAYFFSYSSLASLGGAVLVPVLYLMGDGMAWSLDESQMLALCVMSMLLIYRHTENINRLIKGNESKLELRRKV
ncbi:MAG: hypothetical protein RL211_1112 [Pseudomonadota bacterium]